MWLRTIMPGASGVRARLSSLLPAPNEIPPIISAVVEEGEEPAQREPTDESPFSALAFKIVADKHAGKLTYIRIYSGTLNSGQGVLNSTLGKSQRIGRILRMHANHSENLDSAATGDIVAVVGLGQTRTGDTICDEEHPIQLTSIEFPAPVVAHRAPRIEKRRRWPPCTARAAD